MVFFGLASIVMFFLILLSLKKSLGIIIDQKGIYSNYTMPSVGLIEWKDISNIEINNEEVNLQFTKSKKINQIIVNLKNPEEFFNNKNLIWKVLFKNQYNKFGTPVVLNPLLLNCTFEELKEAVFDSWEKYKKES
ncbi:hypothetical protein ODZ84_15430 [Chryseobacterium fluminis]|nr:hypothetical protein ODZ84_15430 [Chryseobacterium sp. MMS21-Ot14]